MEFLTGFEADRFAGSDADFSPGAGIAADAGFAGADAEHAESAQFDALACGQSFFQSLEDGVDGSFRLGSGQTGTLDDMVDDVLLDQGGTSLAMMESTASYAGDNTGFAAGGEQGSF